MPKKKQYNAFYYFMRDHKIKEEKKGRIITMEQASAEASPIWNTLTPEQKAKYKEMEKKCKADGGPTVIKLTAQGVPISEVERQQREQAKAESDMKKKIQEIVQNSILNDAIAVQNYYFVAGNYFCHHKTTGYLPAEIAIVEYTLQGGVINKFHSFVSPGSLPLGLSFAARHHSEESHQLPLPPNAIGETNYSRLLKEMVMFIADDGAEELPPLFTRRAEVPIVKSIIAQFCADAKEDESLFRVYPLEELFFVLKKAAAKQGQDLDEGFASIHVAHSYLDRDQYECQSGISCEHHDNLDIGKYCALSMVTRYAFTFSDHICLDLAIKLISGAHVPEGVDTITATQATFDPMAWRQPVDPCDDESYDGYDPPDTTLTESKFNDDDDNSVLTFKDENPWAVRRKKVPRRPAKESLKFGRGSAREAIPSNASTISDLNNKPSRSYGRGHLLDTQ